MTTQLPTNALFAAIYANAIAPRRSVVPAPGMVIGTASLGSVSRSGSGGCRTHLPVICFFPSSFL